MDKCGAHCSPALYPVDASVTCLTAETACACYWEARALGLTGFSAEVAAFIAANMKTVAASECSAADALQPMLAAVVRGPVAGTSVEQLRNELTAFKASKRYNCVCDKAGCPYGLRCSSCSQAVTSASSPELQQQIKTLDNLLAK